DLSDPSKDFVYYFAHKAYHGKVTQKVISLFTPLVKTAFSRHMNDLVTDRLKTALDKEMEKQTSEQKKEEDIREEPKIVTTEEEKEAYFIIKSIIRPLVDIGRVQLNDKQTYCAIQLDHTRQPIARLFFGGINKHFTTFSEKKKQTRHDIEELNDMYKYADAIKESVKLYLD